MKYKIMIIEDDKMISNLLSNYLEKFGYDIYLCKDFDNIIEEFRKYDPHLILLDINLPSYDGVYWCRMLRNITSCPIIFISARDTDMDQVFAISNGGDDYITKPFSLDLVIAKIRSLLRRSYGDYSSSNTSVIKLGDCSLFKDKLIIECNGNKSYLSKTECGVLRTLFEEYPNVVSRERLLSELWDDEAFVEENTLNVAVSRSRKKLEEIDSTLSIKTVRGIGYIIKGAD